MLDDNSEAAIFYWLEEAFMAPFLGRTPEGLPFPTANQRRQDSNAEDDKKWLHKAVGRSFRALTREIGCAPPGSTELRRGGFLRGSASGGVATTQSLRRRS